MKKPFLILQIICSVLSGNVVESNLQLVKKDISDTCKDGLIVRYDPGGSKTGMGCYNESSVGNIFNGLATLNNPSRPGLKFSDPYTDRDLMNPGYCIKHCADYLFNYAAIRKDECRCGNDNSFQSYKIENSLSNTICSYNCTFPISSTDNTTYQCGGDQAYTVYEANYGGKPNITVGEKLNIMYSLKNGNGDHSYKECIFDNNHCGQRVLNGTLNIDNDGMTVDKCIDFCTQNGNNFNYAGLSGRRCFCGNAYSTTNVDLEHCSASCPGNNSQVCGGVFTLSVYDASLTTTSTTVDPNQNDTHELSKGQIVGITVGTTGVIVIGGVTYCTCCKLGWIAPAKCPAFCL